MSIPQEQLERMLEGGASPDEALSAMQQSEDLKTGYIGGREPPQITPKSNNGEDITLEGLGETMRGIPSYEEEMQNPDLTKAIAELPDGRRVVIEHPTGMPMDVLRQRMAQAGLLDSPEPTTAVEKGRNILQGALVGYGDEATAAVSAATAKLATMAPGEQAGEDSSFGDIYNDILNKEREQLATTRQAHPYESMMTEMGGGVATAAATKSMPGIGWMGKTTPQQMGVGAAWGAGYGSGIADPSTDLSTLESIKERGKGAVEGAAYGAAGTGVLIGAGKAGQSAYRGYKNIKTAKQAKTYEGRTKLGKEIDRNILLRRASGEDAATVYRHALDDVGIPRNSKAPLQIAQERRSSFQRLAEMTPEQAADRVVADKLMKRGVVMKGMMAAMDDLIEPLYDRIAKHSPRLAQKLRNYEGAVYQDVHNWHTEAQPFIDSVRAMSKGDRSRLDSFLYNGKLREARELFVNSGHSGEIFDAGLSVVDKIGKELRKAGAGFDDVIGFFPRRIKDIEGLKNVLGTEYLTGFSKYQSALSGTGGGREETALNAFMRGVLGSKKKETSMRSRKVREVTEDLMPFYHDSVASLDLFFRESAQHVRRRQLLDRYLVQDADTGVEKINDSIDSLVGDLIDLDPAARNEVAKLLKVRFNQGELGMTEGWSKFRAIAHNSLLGDVVSATTQLGDIGVSAWVNGLMPTVKSLVGKNKITPEELGIMREMVSEISDPGSINNVTEWVFRKSFFRAVDRLGKKTAINGTFTKYSSMAKTTAGKRKLTEELAPFWGDETPQLIDDLAKGKVNDLTKTFLFSKLSDMQPISRTEMPEAFLRMQNGRVVYQLMTWTMKQFNMFRKDIFNKLATGSAKQKAKASKDLVRALVYIGGMNLTSDEAKRFMTGKDSNFENVASDEIFMTIAYKLVTNSFKNFVGSENPFVDITVPTADIALRIADDAKKYGQDVYKERNLNIHGEAAAELSREVVSKIPILGKLYAMWFLGGADKFNSVEETVREERRKLLFGEIKQDD